MEDQEQQAVWETDVLLGENTVSAPTTLAKGQWRRLRNVHQGQSIGPAKQRPGSVPVTDTALGSPAEILTRYRSNDKIMTASGTSLYKYDSGTEEWVAITGALNQADIYEVDYTSTLSAVEPRKIIADEGDLKEYDDSAGTVSAIVPAADAPAPAPANYLSVLNTRGPKFVWSYRNRVFIAFESYDVWYSDLGTRDYFASINVLEWHRNNDHVNGCGIAFDNACLIPMRKGWGVLLGSTFDDFQGNLFLNTPAGVIAPRSIQRITYPNGVQTIAYLSDNGVQEIYDTGFEGEGSRRYSTRNLMTDKVDFEALGLTESEKAAAVGHFDAEMSLYILSFKQGDNNLVYAYDTRNSEWYPWTNIVAKGFVRVGDVLYYAGDTGHLHKFDDSLGSDWDDKDMTEGTPIDFDCITDLIAFEYTGYASILDYIIASAKQYSGSSKIDIYLVTYSGIEEYLEALRNQYLFWDLGEWDETTWTHMDYTDLVGRPIRVKVKKKSHYFQVRFRNNRDELAELYKFRLIARTSGN